MKKYVIATIIIGVILMSQKIAKIHSFEECFKIIIGHEGRFQNIHNDRGNWTTGIIGQGINKGTKYGVSAMSYPHLDIINLTLEQAREIYKRDYWDKLKIHEPLLNLMAFDSAINHGLVFANNRLAETKNMSTVLEMIAHFELKRLEIYLNHPQSSTFINGWKKRLADIVNLSGKA